MNCLSGENRSCQDPNMRFVSTQHIPDLSHGLNAVYVESLQSVCLTLRSTGGLFGQRAYFTAQQLLAQLHLTNLPFTGMPNKTSDKNMTAEPKYLITRCVHNNQRTETKNDLDVCKQ